MKDYTEEEIKEIKDDIKISLLGRDGNIPKLIKILKYMPEDQVRTIIKICNDLRDVIREW